MNTTIESLKALYSKLGGTEDVSNINTIPDAIDAVTSVASGSSDPYETVAEIAVGEMKEEEGLYVYSPDTPFTDNLQSGDALFLEVGTEKYPLEIIRDDEEGFLAALWYNWSDDEGATGTPAFYLEYESDNGVFESLVSTEDLSNTTVKILKKVGGEQSGGELPEVTSADNGDVLTVVEGAWAKAAPSGGNKFVVTLEKTLENLLAIEISENPDHYENEYPTWVTQLTQAEYESLINTSHLYFNERTCEASKTSESSHTYIFYNFELNSNLPIAVKNESQTAYYLDINTSSNYKTQFICSTNISPTIVNIKTDGNSYVADKSVSECIAAEVAGKVVECVGEDGIRCALMYSNDETMCIFSLMAIASGGISYVTVFGQRQGEGQEDQWDVMNGDFELPDNLKSTYEFGFTVTSDGQGGYTCTPASGVTYSAITDALDETPNVYAAFEIAGNTIRCLFNEVTSTIVSAQGVMYTGSSFSGYRVVVSSDDSCYINIVPLAAAST